MPKTAEWLKVDNKGQRWSLASAQARDERFNKSGDGRKGKICGNYLARGDRCFNCKYVMVTSNIPQAVKVIKKAKQLIENPCDVMIYRTCAVDNTSVLCSSCFFASDHTGHDITFGIAYSFSGYCDCGDPSSWSRPCSCPLHPPQSNPSLPSSSSLNVLPPPSDLPARRIQGIRETIEICMDFIIQTFEAGPIEGNLAVPRTIEEVIYETQGSRTTPVAGGVGAASSGNVKGKGRLEAVSLVLWSDEKHTAKEVARQVSHATGMGKSQAQALVGVLEREVSFNLACILSWKLT